MTLTTEQKRAWLALEGWVPYNLMGKTTRSSFSQDGKNGYFYNYNKGMMIWFEVGIVEDPHSIDSPPDVEIEAMYAFLSSWHQRVV